MNLPPLTFTVLDTETTGFVPKVHRVIEFACVRVEKGKVMDEYEHLYAIPEEIPPHIQVLTRIKPAALAGKPALPEVREDILRHLGSPQLLVGQNLGFDLSMLKGEGIDLTHLPWVDTSMLASLVFPELRSYSLQYLSATLGLHHEPVHRALGDVRATLELFAKIWERLCQLPPDMRHMAKKLFARSTPGYRLVSEAIADASTAVTPPWNIPSQRTQPSAERAALDLLPPATGIALREEELHAEHLERVLDACVRIRSHRHFVAVKNLEATLRRIHLPEGAGVLYPPWLLLDPDAAARMAAQESLTAEEASLAVKVAWFSPHLKSDIAVHGNEKDIWNGRLACTEESNAYRAQFADPPGVLLVDHRQLLTMLADPASPGHTLLEGAHIIVDDASMLEDTATKAYGHALALDELREAARGHERLSRLADLAVIWTERMRREMDLVFLTEGDLGSPETRGLRHQVQEILGDQEIASRTRELLRELDAILTPETFEGELRWIEQWQNGSLSLHSAPEHVDERLHAHLYGAHPTTLLVPGGLEEFPEVIPAKMAVQRDHARSTKLPGLTIAFPPRTMAQVLAEPPPGKTILLVQSKHAIEKLFVEHTEALEERGITLICLGMGGGMNRMEADFLASPAPTILVLTPWVYEGSELPPECVDHLILDTLPFDNPSQPVFSKRKGHYRDSFREYSLPRLEQRLFRLLRTFARHRTPRGDLQVLDKRLHEKDYGKHVKAYLARFGERAEGKKELTPVLQTDEDGSAQKGVGKKSATKRSGKKLAKSTKDDALPEQPSLF